MSLNLGFSAALVSCLSLHMLAFAIPTSTQFFQIQPMSLRNVPLPYYTKCNIHSFGGYMWVPIHCRRRAALSMICNSFFKEWLLPSPSLDCLHYSTFFNTDIPLGDLSQWSGLFPSWPWTFPPRVCLSEMQI